VNTKSDIDSRDNALGRRAWVHVAILVVASVAVFANGLSGDFTFDDVHLIVTNTRLDEASGAVLGFTSDYYTSSERDPSGELRALGYYRPVVVFLNWLDNQLWGRDRPFGFHLTNLLFHLGAVVCLYLLLARLVKRREIAFAAALLFAVHPAHTESVTFISGRVDVVAGFFSVLSLLMFVRSWTSSARTRFVGLSLLFYFLALISKEMAVTLPAAVFLVAGLLSAESSNRWRGAFIKTLPFAGVFIVYLVVRLAAIGSLVSRSGGLGDGGGAWPRVATVLFEYLRLLVWPPFGFNVEPPVAIPGSIDGAVLLKTLVVLAVVAVGIVAARKRMSPVALGILWALAALLPVAQIVRVETMVGERFLYIPTIGACLLVGALISALSNRFGGSSAAGARLWLVPLLILGVAYGANTIHRNGYWENNLTFWKGKVELSPESAEAHSALGIEYAARGRTPEAFSEYREALIIDPNHFEALHNIALVLLESGRPDEALQAAHQAAQLHPQDPVSRNTLGTAFFSVGEYGLAIGQYKRAVRLDQGYVEAWVNLGNTYFTVGVGDSARRAYEVAVSLGAGEQLRYQAARAAAIAGDIDGGVEYLVRGGLFAPGSVRALIVRGNLAAEAGDVETAVASLRQAIELAPTSVEAWHELGFVFARANRFAEAKQTFERALSIDPNSSVIHNSLGVLAEQMGDLQTAIRHFREAARRAPDDPEVLRNLGGALVQTGQYDLAFPLLERSLAFFASDHWAFYYRGWAHQETGNASAAISSLKTAITLQPTFAEAYYRLGEVYSKEGQNALAAHSYEQFLKYAARDHPQRGSAEMMIQRLKGE